MSGTLLPLNRLYQIVDKDGHPTEFFIRWAQQKQIDITGSMALSDLTTYLAAHKLIAGTGIQLTPDGNLNSGVTIHADVQAILDEISATRGIVIYRGLLGWSALLPGTAGNVLSTNGPGADPTWIAPAGGGGLAAPTLRSNAITTGSAASYVVTWPAGTVAGDVVIIFGHGGWGFTTPANWTQLDNTAGSGTNGILIAKTMTSADITAGSVTIAAAGAFNSTFIAVTIIGTTCKGIRDWIAVQSGSSLATWQQDARRIVADELVLSFIGDRPSGVGATFTWSGNTAFTLVNNLNTINAPAAFAKCNNTQVVGSYITITASNGGTYYHAIVRLCGG